MNIFNNIYKNKKILVTGHTGFKGSWLTFWLIELGATVIGYSLEPPTSPNLFEILNLEKKIIHINGDVRDLQKLNEVLEKHKPEIIFHLAAQSLVRLSYKEPKLTFETNIMGTINLFEALRKSESVRVFINITSDKCYKNREWVYGYRECDPVGGFDPYSCSKGCSELITASYRNSYFNPSDYNKIHKVSIASARAGNVIGGGDWAEDRLFPDCIKSILNDKPIIIRNPKSVRPWQYVLEPLSGYLWLGALMIEGSEKFNEAWNFGPHYNNIITVVELVEKIIDFWGKGTYSLEEKQDFYEANLLKLDLSKSYFHLKWKPIYNITETLKATIDWYKNYYQEKENIFEFSLKQIEEYVNSGKNKKIAWCNK